MNPPLGQEHYSRPAWRWELGAVLIGITLAGLFAIVCALVVGCAPLQVGPFVPNPPHYCHADPDCGDNQICKSPSIASPRLVCMRGTNSIYGWSPTPSPGGD
jgi:hypothetical protein